MKSNSIFFMPVLVLFVFTSAFSQYTAEYPYDQESLSSLGLDYQPENPLVIDYLNSGEEKGDPLSYPILYQDDTKTPWAKTDTGRSLIISGALIGVGLFTYKDSGWLNRVDIKEGINRYLPNYQNKIDDYVQYIPWAAVYAFDAAGVKSKHTTKRKLTTMATGAAASLIVIQGLKYGIGETRPDGSANNSFPSGHTATAFMGAHIFHKEYGDRSIYYSIGGYMLATFTGIFRQLNDRHWISDVFVGAGLGISLTEFAYFLNDKWWGDKGINEIDIVQKDPNRDRPSFLGVKFGYAGLTSEFDDPESGISARSGFTIGVDGAWFFSKHIGVGGEFGFQSFPIRIDQAVIDEFSQLGYDIAFQPMGNSKNVFGPHFQVSWGKSMLGAKILAGWARVANTQVFLKQQVGDEPSEADDLIYAEISPEADFAWTTGLYYRWLIDERLALSVFADYNGADLNTPLRYLDSFDADNNPIYAVEPLNEPFDSFTAGISFNVMIW